MPCDVGRALLYSSQRLMRVIFLANSFVTKTYGIISDDSGGENFCNIAAEPVGAEYEPLAFRKF
jgi:hypothetical protein